MQNLRDKLLKAGLVTEGDTQRAETERRRPPSSSQPPRAGARPGPRTGSRPDARSGGGGGGGGGALIPKLPPLPVANNKEFQRLEAKKQLELDRRIREEVLATQVEVPPGGHTFFFVTRKNRLRRLETTPEFAARLESGELAVVERPDPGQIEHAVVPAGVADELLRLQERSVRFYNRKEAPVGFITDEELSRRQQAEAAHPEAEEMADAPAAPDTAAAPATAEGTAEAPSAERAQNGSPQ